MKRYFILIFLLLTLGCEKEIQENRTGIPVVFGLLISRNTEQYIFVDTTSSMFSPSDSLGVSGADVFIYHGDSLFKGEEIEKGIYSVKLQVVPGEKYRVVVNYKDYTIEDTVMVLDTPVIYSPSPQDTIYIGFSKEKVVWRSVDNVYSYRVRAIFLGEEDTTSLFPVVAEDTLVDLFNTYPYLFPEEGNYKIKVIAYQKDYGRYMVHNESEWDSLFGLLSSINFDEVYVYIKKPQYRR